MATWHTHYTFFEKIIKMLLGCINKTWNFVWVVSPQITRHVATSVQDNESGKNKEFTYKILQRKFINDIPIFQDGTPQKRGIIVVVFFKSLLGL